MYDVFSMKTFAKKLNDLTFTDYYYRLMLIARSIYKWDNLPNGIDEKWIESFLYSYGNCVFFNDKDKGFMVAKCTQSGELNFYDEPTLLQPYGTNFTGDELENNYECVLIRNNDLMIPTAPTLQLYAYRLAEISRTIDVNVNAQKTPIMLLCNEKQKLSMKRMFSQVDENEVAIYGSKDLEMDNIKALKLEAPVVFDKLQIQKHAIWNECMSFLGINNANMDKRERLVSAEVGANNEQVEISGDVFLKSRQQACEQLNKLFGLNITVEKRIQSVDEIEDLEELNEGGENYDN